MSRREDRTSDLKRYRSRFGRELSPKRSRRDDRPDAERPRPELESDKARLDRDDKHRRRIQDHDLKNDSGTRSKESEGRTDVHKAGAKHANDPTKVPQPRSHFQHDDRGRAGHGRSFGRRTESEHRWRESQSDRRINRTVSVNLYGGEEMVNSRVWQSEMGANPKPTPMQKRPSFREQKFRGGPETMKNRVADDWMAKGQCHGVESGNRDESFRSYAAGERDLNKDDGSWRGSGYRSQPRPSGGDVEKWKHDLYDEANRSPCPKNEEDEISKIEALLAS